nr:uncharacterized protein LOC129257737 [Lytechinus pictus]
MDVDHGSPLIMETHRSGGLKRSRDEQMGPGAKERRTRTIFNSAQIEALERIFMDVEYPDGDLKAKLAHRLEVDESTVQIWFQNRRAKKKRLQRGVPGLNSQGTYRPHHGVSHLGHLLPISDRQNYMWSTAEGVAPYPSAIHSVTRSSQCYSVHGTEMGNQNLPITWTDKTNFSSIEHDPRYSLQSQESHVASIKENSSSADPIMSSSSLPTPTSPVISPVGSEGGTSDQIRKWPVKETPTSRSAFGKLDFPKLPRVCIRHDMVQMRNSPNGDFGASSPVTSEVGKRDIVKLRMNVLKKDPPKSPPPNQTCAAIPRSQRNELELALVKHGLVEETSPNGPSGSISGHRGGYISEDWSSSSEESSDSEGLAPPRRRRKVFRNIQKPPPNASCASVPLHDRTLPYLSKIPQYSSEQVPKGQAVGTSINSSSSMPLQSFDQSVHNENLSDWDTDSDDSTWAYFDQGPKKETDKSKASQKSPHDAKTGQLGPQSAPPALVPEEGSDVNSMSANKHSERAGNVGDCNDDDFSEILLAREFAEMLPSPLGTYLPMYHEEPSQSSKGGEPYRRPRILSDSALVTPRLSDYRPQPPLDINPRTSPVSTRSSDSSLSGLSSLFNIPVSPSELVKHLTDDVVGTDQSTVLEIPASSCTTESRRHLPETLLKDIHDEGMVQNFQQPMANDNNRDQFEEQNQTGSFFMNDSQGNHNEAHFRTSECKTIDGGKLQKPNSRINIPSQGIIRPIPTRPHQVATSTSDHGMIHASQSGTHKNNMMHYQNNSSIQEANLQQGAAYGQLQAHGHPYQIHSGPGFQDHVQPCPGHFRVNDQPQGVVHHQPPSMSTSQYPSRFPGDAYKARFPRHSADAPPKNVSLPIMPPQRSVLGASVPSDDNLPPNQVCTVVPDAVSSQGLMARYLAWTQGRSLHA